MAVANTKSAPITFGQRYANAAVPPQEKPKSEFWLNIGYTREVETEEGIDSKFVSLPIGIPLDTQEHVNANSRNNDFAEFQSARNDLLDEIMEFARTLEPGKDAILNLEIQLRRINEDRPSVPSTSNKFSRTGLSLVKA